MVLGRPVALVNQVYQNSHVCRPFLGFLVVQWVLDHLDLLCFLQDLRNLTDQEDPMPLHCPVVLLGLVHRAHLEFRLHHSLLVFLFHP